MVELDLSTFNVGVIGLVPEECESASNSARRAG